MLRPLPAVAFLPFQPHSFLLPPPPFVFPAELAPSLRRNLRRAPPKSSTFLAGIPSVSAADASLIFTPVPPSESDSYDDSHDWFDPATLSAFLVSASSPAKVERLHAAALRRSLFSLTFVGNNLISAYARFLDLDSALKVFDAMATRNVISWTAIINAHLRMNLDDEVIRLFDEMLESHVEANSMTYVCLLKSCGNSSKLELGRQIHACVLKGNWGNRIVDSTLVYFYAECDDITSARRVFDRMPSKDVITWTTMITAHVQGGREQKALLMFQEMHGDDLAPNEFTVCSILKACGELKALSFGKQLHCAIAKGMYKNDVHVGTSLINMYSWCGEVSDARIVFNLMPNRNTVTWTSMISGYANCGLGEEAILLFQRMKQRRISASDLTTVSILSACGWVGSSSMGKEVHTQIIKNSICENIQIGSTLIWFYCKCGNYAYAVRVFEAMPVKDVVSWTAIISGLANLGHGLEALKFLNGMLSEGVEPNPFTYSSALKACSMLEAVDHGKWIHAHVSKNFGFSNVFVGGALIDMYMRCGCTSDALRVFEMMEEHNLVSWKMMVIGYARNGLCQDALKFMYQMRQEGFHVDDYVHATVLGACGDVNWESQASADSCIFSV
ncbi:pentatricopeptide repeat-containing protein At4g18520, chloroplastic-like [Curcuma longa]|uniref:pentatricopeptide repeat-containing protein At4g18520, chloroplastic-like n=1 Tax=Curcuma longa TaxID=136217 RepID=UPI003D9ECC5F